MARVLKVDERGEVQERTHWRDAFDDIFGGVTPRVYREDLLKAWRETYGREPSEDEWKKLDLHELKEETK